MINGALKSKIDRIWDTTWFSRVYRLACVSEACSPVRKVAEAHPGPKADWCKNTFEVVDELA